MEYDHEFFADDLLVSNCLAWLEELAAWRYLDDAWDQMRFGLRSGPHPRWIASTTPRPRVLIKALANGEHRDTVVTRATMYDNPHLPQHIRDALEERYRDTQRGRQELLGHVIDEDENALWTHAALDAARVDPADLPPMVLKTVGVDPSGGAGEQGIVVAGKSGLWLPEGSNLAKPRHHGFVLADYTCHLDPDGWGRRVVQAAIDHEADDVTVEINYGRDMAVSTVRAAAEAIGVNIPIHVVTATRGKRVRAEPVSALTSQGRWHHAGSFPALEDQLCLVAGTRVETARGQVPIEQVRPGDLAMTRNGWAPVAWAGQTGTTTELTGVQVVDCELWMTPGHPLYLPDQDRFAPARNVRRGQPLAVSSSRTDSDPWHGGVGGGAWRNMATTATGALDSCSTGPSGLRTTAPSRTGTWSTTGTKTSGITSAGTWKSKPTGNIWRNTEEYGGPSRRTVPPGASDEWANGLYDSPPPVSVWNATHRFSPPANARSTATDVVHVRLSTAVPVYNLMISEGWLPEFFANGILVHNCTWTPELDWSPDRLDAMVWDAVALKLAHLGVGPAELVVRKGPRPGARALG